MIQQNRAAEYGSEIVSNTSLRTFPRQVIAIKALEDTVISAIVSDDNADRSTLNLAAYYNGKTLFRGETIAANVKSITLTSGAVQAFYAA